MKVRCHNCGSTDVKLVTKGLGKSPLSQFICSQCGFYTYKRDIEKCTGEE